MARNTINTNSESKLVKFHAYRPRKFLPLAVISLFAILGSAYMLVTHASPMYVSTTNCKFLSTSSTLTRGGGSTTLKDVQQLGRGNANACVKNVQSYLNTYCSAATDLKSIDGIFGARTEAAVKAYQRYSRDTDSSLRVNGSRISVDGIVGRQMWMVMRLSNNSGGGTLNCS